MLRSQRGPHVAFLVLASGIALASLVLVPMWGAPDEPQHFLLARLVSDLGRWPTLAEARTATGLLSAVHESMVASQFWPRQRHRDPPPSLLDDTSPDNLLPPVYARPAYYALAALLLRLWPTGSLEGQFYLLRGLSALLSVLSAVCAFAIARQVFGRGSPLAWAASALVVLLPMRTFLAPSVNSDALAEVLGSSALLLMIVSLRKGASPLRAQTVGLVAGAGLWVKRTLFFLIPLAGVWLLLWLSQARVSRRDRWLGAMALATGLVLSGGSAFLWHGAPAVVNWPFPGHDPHSPLGVAAEVSGQLFSPENWSAKGLLRLGVNLSLTAASFWGNFGWLTVPMNPGIYILLGVLTAAATAGAGVALFRGRTPPSETRSTWWLLAAAAALSSAQLVALTLAEGIMQQGRYLFPALAPVACLMVLGWNRLLPGRARRLLPYATAIGLAALSTWSWLGLILPALRW